MVPLKMPPMTSNRLTVFILYTNHRGETAWRRIEPILMYFADCEHHPGEQWLLNAFDLDKMANRTFAMRDVHKWQTEAPQHYENHNICKWCGHDMDLGSKGCTRAFLTNKGKSYRRLGWGEADTTSCNCPVCKTPPQEFHHSGCSFDMCTICYKTSDECKCHE